MGGMVKNILADHIYVCGRGFKNVTMQEFITPPPPEVQRFVTPLCISCSSPYMNPDIKCDITLSFCHSTF